MVGGTRNFAPEADLWDHSLRRATVGGFLPFPICSAGEADELKADLHTSAARIASEPAGLAYVAFACRQAQARQAKLLVSGLTRGSSRMNATHSVEHSLKEPGFDGFILVVLANNRRAVIADY